MSKSLKITICLIIGKTIIRDIGTNTYKIVINKCLVSHISSEVKKVSLRSKSRGLLLDRMVVRGEG